MEGLRAAVRKNNLGRVQQALRAQETVSLLLTDGSEPSLLHVALSRGHGAVVGALLRAGAVPAPSEATALLVFAVQYEATAALITELLAAIPQPELAAAVNGRVKGWTPLMHAAKFDQCGAMSTLLSKGAEIDATIPVQGGSALMIAVQHAQAASVSALLSAGADVALRDADGWGALQWAAQGGHVGILRVLIDAWGALEGGETTSPPTAAGPSAAATSAAAQPAAEPAAESPLRVAVMNGNLEAVEMLIGAGRFDLDASDAQGYTAVAVAAASGFTRILDALLRAGANPSLCTSGKRRTPLMLAALSGHTAALRLLIERARSDAATDAAQQTPPLPHTAVATLIEQAHTGNGVDTAAADTAAAESSSFSTCSPPPRAYVDICDVGGVTALMFASKGGHESAVELLLEAGADANMAATLGSNHGQAALEFAARSGAVAVARILLRNGATNAHVIARSLMLATISGSVPLVQVG